MMSYFSNMNDQKELKDIQGPNKHHFYIAHMYFKTNQSPNSEVLAAQSQAACHNLRTSDLNIAVANSVSKVALEPSDGG